MSDHLVSEALYLTDPDGLGIEVYADRPRDDVAARGSAAHDDHRPARRRSRARGGGRRAVGRDAGRHGDRARAPVRRRIWSVRRRSITPAWDSTRPSGAIPARCSCRPAAITTTSATNTWATGRGARGCGRCPAAGVGGGGADRCGCRGGDREHRGGGWSRWRPLGRWRGGAGSVGNGGASARGRLARSQATDASRLCTACRLPACSRPPPARHLSAPPIIRQGRSASTPRLVSVTPISSGARRPRLVAGASQLVAPGWRLGRAASPRHSVCQRNNQAVYLHKC